MLNKSTEIILENFFMLPIIILEESEMINALPKQMKIRELRSEIKGYIERNPNSVFEICVENEEHSLCIRHNIIDNSRTRMFRITMNDIWNDFKVEQLSESHIDLFVPIKNYKL